MDNKQNAKYAFYYLLSLVALVFMSLSVGMIAFSIIDKTIPDILNNTVGAFDSQLKFAISALFIAAPIFYVVSSFIHKGLHKGELNKESGIRRWLTYFILLVSSLVVLGVFIGVINVFLGGEFTGRFILKALSVFIISGAVFAFYFYDIKRESPDKADKVVKIFFFSSLGLVVAAFVASWFFVESPQVARNRRIDQALINNIYSIESSVNSYYDKYHKLPDILDSVKNDGSIYTDPQAFIDPETKAPIIYNRVSDKDFELCATFRQDSSVDNGTNGRYAYPVSTSSDNKNHRAGYQCLKGNLYSLNKQAVD